MRKLAIVLAVLLIAAPLIAVNPPPTGTAHVSYYSAQCPPYGPLTSFGTYNLNPDGSVTVPPPTGLQALPVGSYCFRADYSGDTYNKGGTSNFFTYVVQPIQQSNTATTISISPTPNTVGQDGVFTIQVSQTQ